MNLQKGIYAGVLIPMHEDYHPDPIALAKHCLDLIAKGCQGVVLFGTTGEGSSFSTKEKLEVLKAVIAMGVNPQKIIMAAGGSIPDTVSLMKGSLALSCTTFLIVPPSYYKKVTEEGVIEYYRSILKSCPDSLKVLLYHIPQYSGVPISIGMIRALKEEFSQVIGLKESEGNLLFTEEILKTFPGFQVFVGNENQIREAVQKGASGSICGLANLFPELLCSLFKDQRESDAEKVNAFLARLKKFPFIPGAKAWMEKVHGPIWKTLRPPLAPLKSSEKEAL